MLGFYLAMIDTPKEKSVFEELYKEYKSIMYNNAYQILKDNALAEDAVHNAFLAIIGNSKKIYNMDCDERRNYLLIINRNAAYGIYKKIKKNRILMIMNIRLFRLIILKLTLKLRRIPKKYLKCSNHLAQNTQMFLC